MCSDIVLEYLKIFVSWPFLVFLLLLITRKDIADVLRKLTERIRTAEVGGQKFEFADRLEKLETTTNILERAARYGVGGRRKKTEEAAGFAETAVEPGADAEDPWKGQFGGREERDGRRIAASVADLPDRPGWFSVALSVEATSSEPLRGPVQFYLHPSFSHDKPIVRPGPDGKAHLDLTAWGAFTVGALVDGGFAGKQ